LKVLGLVILRVKEPLLERCAGTAVCGTMSNLGVRPYKTWIVTPLMFCAVSFLVVTGSSALVNPVQVALFLLCMPIIAAPLEAMAVLGDL